MKATARGLTTPEGREPALWASTPSPPWRRANASAIWLRLAFSTHTKRMRGRVDTRSTPGGGAPSRLQGVDLDAGRVVVDVVAGEQLGQAIVQAFFSGP